ncbi:MAG TPA: type II toxin-antitoxin system VapC family toxin [Thermoanaerobaculia bacterium]
MRPKLYIETSIVSYLTAQPSRDIVTAARQQITREWWQTKRSQFDLYVSEFVIGEAGSGNVEAAALRLAALEGIPELALTEQTARFAAELVSKGVLPGKAALDALHIAAAVSGGVDYLLTWNFKHLANAAVRGRIDRACRSYGFEPCIICTPEELVEE